MSIRCLIPSLLAAGLALTGCGAIAPGADDGTVTATAHLGAARRALNVEPWRKADIHHVRVSLYKNGGSTAIATQDVANAELDGTIRFTNLRKFSSYMVVLTAWSDEDELSRIDDAQANAASCSTTFATLDAPWVDAGTLKLKLRDKYTFPPP